jgi:hypothetical protein
MFKKFNTKTLLIILVILGALVALNKFYLSKKSESTIDEYFVQIDSGTVKQVFIYPKNEKGKEIKLTKTDKGWEVTDGKMKSNADTAEVNRLLASFANVKTLSLAAEDKSGWGDYMVADSAGSRIRFISDDNKTDEMIVGKFSFNPAARNGATYIRHANEDKVYSVVGYIALNVNRGFTSWRMKTVMAGNKDSWNSLTFSYPGDSSFTLVKQNNKWMLYPVGNSSNGVNGQPVDATKTDQYLTQLANKQSSGFLDGYIQNAASVYTLSVSSGNQAKTVTIQAFPADSVQKLVLHSSLNPDAWFSESKNPVAQSIFVGKQQFLRP